MEITEWLVSWYKTNCDGDWEHTYGIKIDTLDNPGWSFKVDLLDTIYEGKKIYLKVSDNDEDWYEIHSDGELFTGFGDPSKLQLLMNLFKEFIEKD